MIVLKIAVLSRLFILFFAIICGYLVQDYDTSFSIQENSGKGSLFDALVEYLRPLGHWDGVYFQKIAQSGYEYEQMHAFFPFYPFLIREIAIGTCNFLILTNKGFRLFLLPSNSILLAGVIVSNVCFVLAACDFYLLSKKLLVNKNIALIASILFCISPASIFMSSIYTESLYAFLTFKGLLYLESQQLIASSVFFAFAGATRSNGFLYGIFYGFNVLYSFFHMLRNEQSKKLFATTMISNIVCCVVIVLPYLAFQYYGYRMYCTDGNTLQLEWCKERIPHMYSYVQRHYWKQGFLNYYQLNQFPNFLIASPMILLSIIGIYQLLTASNLFLSSKKGVPYVVFWTIFLLISITSTHVQTITRFFSSMPPLYWYCATTFKQEEEGRRNITSFFILSYFCSFAIIGTVLFSNFYPWT